MASMKGIVRGTRRIRYERSLGLYRVWEWQYCFCTNRQHRHDGHWEVLCDIPDQQEAEDIASWRQPLVYWD